MPERLELEPAGKMRADQNVSVLCGFGRDPVGLAGGFGQQLRLAGAVHGDKPPGGFVDRVADRKQAVVAEDGGLLGAEGASDAVSLGRFFDHAAVIIEHHMIFVKRTRILGERVEAAAKRGPRLAIQGMGMRGGHDVRAGSVNAGMNGKGCKIDFRVAFDHFAGVIDQNQVGGANLAEMQTEGIHPKMIDAFGIARGDVAGDAFVKTKFGKETKSGGEAFLAMTAFFGRSGEDRRAGDALHEGTARG